MNLSVTIPTKRGGWVLKNPIMPAAACFGNIIEYKDIVDLGRLGAMMPNSLSVRQGSPSKAKKYYQADCGMITSFALNNITIGTFVDDVLPALPWRETPVVVDLKGYNMEEMQQAAQIAAGAEGIAAIEVNLNCPYGNPGAAPYWKDPKQLETLMRMVRDVAKDKFVIAKTATSEVPIGEVLAAVDAGGADLFVAFNAVSGGCAIDIEKRSFQCGMNGMGGYSGPGLKPYALGRTLAAARIGTLPVIGGGGITCAEDVLEYIMAGAWAVQVGSANLTMPNFMLQLLDDLEKLMARLGIRSLDEVRGAVL